MSRKSGHRFSDKDMRKSKRARAQPFIRLPGGSRFEGDYMVEHRLKLFAVAAALSLGAATQAAAGGGCCPPLYGGCGCGLTLPLGQQVIEPYDISSGVYVVNQGPIFTGPGHYLARESPNAVPGPYPYVGVVFSGYPYGQQSSGGYPRGLYSPYTGYPYSEPARTYGLRTYVNYKTSLRPARVYRRPVWR
jgi:hypothetical protein